MAPLYRKKPVSYLLAALLLLPPVALGAQDYDTFDDNSKRRIEQFMDRGDRLDNEQAWSNYIDLGVATERISWETQAYEQLQEKIADIEETQTDEDTRDAEIAAAEADYEDALEQWESDATNYVNEGRGKFLAREEALDVARNASLRFEGLIAAAEAQAAQEAALGSQSDGAAFGLTTPRDLLADFDQQLNAEMSRARATAAGLDGYERDNFEEELQDIEANIRREYDIRKSYFLSGEDNQLIALPRNDELDAKLAPARETAATAREELIENAREAVEEDTAEKLKQARTDFERRIDESGRELDPDELAAEWEKETATILGEAQKEWDKAAENYGSRQTTWLRERGTPSGQERQAWTENRRSFEAARAEWQKELQAEFDSARADQEERLEILRRDADEDDER